MREFFQNAYRTGFLPWEASAASDRGTLERLLARETAEHNVPPGRALDLGCGRGFQARSLAAAGWDVVGIDYIPEAIEAAKAEPGGEAVDFVTGDVTELESEVTGSFDLILDIGCFHSLSEADRLAYARGVNSVASDEATALLLAMTPGAPPPAPPGARRDEIEGALGASWELADDLSVPTENMPTIPAGVGVHFFRFRRRP